MAGKEGVHEGFEIRSPPLRKSVANLPVRVRICCCVLRCQAFIQTGLEAANFFRGSWEVVAWSVE